MRKSLASRIEWRHARPEADAAARESRPVLVCEHLPKLAAATREKYGKHLWCQQALLARRLVEAGTTRPQDADYANTSFTTCPWTSVRRRSEPSWRTLSFSWSMPMRCRIVAWMS